MIYFGFESEVTLLDVYTNSDWKIFSLLCIVYIWIMQWRYLLLSQHLLCVILC